MSDEDLNEELCEPPTKKRRLNTELESKQATDDELELEESEDSTEMIEMYEGEYNSDGLYHGLGRLMRPSQQQTYIGYFRNGEFDGRGILYLNNDRSTFLDGSFKDGSFHCPLGGGSYIQNNTALIYGTFINDDCHGYMREYVIVSNNIRQSMIQSSPINTIADLASLSTDVSLNKESNVIRRNEVWYDTYLSRKRLIFEGMYQNNERNGKGTLYYCDGGRINGIWLNGAINDTNAIYTYSDSKSTLIGEWRNNAMVCAYYHSAIDKCDTSEATNDTSAINSDESDLHSTKAVSYCEDIPTMDSIGKYALLSEPFESERVYVKQSTLVIRSQQSSDDTVSQPTIDAGEGLFAKRAMKCGEVVSFYGGIHIRPTDADSRDWIHNSNVLHIDNQFSVDVPKEYCDVKTQYCATLGHKSNHNWLKQNARYEACYHPRFGDIKCLRLIADVSANDEIFVDYDYKDEFPNWYTQQFAQ